MSTTTSFDLERFARAAEQRDASTQLSMYAYDATVTIADKVSQPGSPRVLRTRGEIKTWRLPNRAMSFIHEILPTDDGSVWMTLEAQGGLARFDTKTEKFEVFIDQEANTNFNVAKPAQKDPNDPFPNLPEPAGPQGGGARSHTAVIDHEGNIWASGRPLKKFDTKTQRYTYFGADAPDTYGIDVDQAGNVWFAQFNARDHQDIGMVDVNGRDKLQILGKISETIPNPTYVVVPTPGATRSANISKQTLPSSKARRCNSALSRLLLSAF